jgi:hypothetical protein
MKMKFLSIGKMPLAFGAALALLLVVGVVSAVWAPTRVRHQLEKMLGQSVKKQVQRKETWL